MNFKIVCVLYLIVAAPTVTAGTIAGHLRDPNWYARPSTNDPFGVGYYEYAINANADHLTTLGGADDTDVFGAFQMPNLSAAIYTVASWDVWWRSAYGFDVLVGSNQSAAVDLRLHATMWGYPAFWDNTGYHEFGQTFVATGPITIIYLRNPLQATPNLALTVHEGGPTGPQIGVARTFNGYWDVRLIYGYGQMPAIKGRTYYVRIRTPSPSQNGILCQMDPRPDFSDPMPDGWLYLGNGTTLTPFPDRD